MLKNYRDLIEMVAKNPIETDPFEGPPLCLIVLLLIFLENNELLLQRGQGLYLYPPRNHHSPWIKPT